MDQKFRGICVPVFSALRFGWGWAGIGVAAPGPWPTRSCSWRGCPSSPSPCGPQPWAGWTSPGRWGLSWRYPPSGPGSMWRLSAASPKQFRTFFGPQIVCVWNQCDPKVTEIMFFRFFVGKKNVKSGSKPPPRWQNGKNCSVNFFKSPPAEIEMCMFSISFFLQFPQFLCNFSDGLRHHYSPSAVWSHKKNSFLGLGKCMKRTMGWVEECQSFFTDTPKKGHRRHFRPTLTS